MFWKGDVCASFSEMPRNPRNVSSPVAAAPARREATSNRRGNRCVDIMFTMLSFRNPHAKRATLYRLESYTRGNEENFDLLQKETDEWRRNQRLVFRV